MSHFHPSDPCEYNTIANNNLPIVRQLLERLIQIQRQARPVWFPERDPKANPALFNGFWGPWQKNPANKKIMKDKLTNIPIIGKNKACAKEKDQNVTSKETIYRGHEAFHSLLHKILKKTKEKVKSTTKGKHRKTKKTTILNNEENQIKLSVLSLFDEMNEKTHDREGKKIVGRIDKRYIKEVDQVGTAIKIDKRRSSKSEQDTNELFQNQDETVKSIVKQSIEEKHKELDSENENGASTISYIIHDLENDSNKYFGKSKRKNSRRSEIPKPKENRKENILSELSKVFKM